MTYIQIGTKDGADEFNAIVRRDNPLIVILVEPNTEHNGAIHQNYKDVTGRVYVENVAITAEPSGMVSLVHPAVPIGGMEFDSGKFSLLPMDDWGDNFVHLKAPGMTFNSLCSKYGIRHVDYLQIDTEGYDAEIIKSINFDKISIDKIKYEIWHFPSNCFTRHGEKGKQYGLAGMNTVAILLNNLGYKFEYLPYDIIATK